MKDKEWFEIHLEDISSSEDFEEAMELAHVKGFEDGFESGEEEGYNAGIYSSVVEEKIAEATKEEQKRIIQMLHGWGYVSPHLNERDARLLDAIEGEQK